MEALAECHGFAKLPKHLQEDIVNMSRDKTRQPTPTARIVKSFMRTHKQAVKHYRHILDKRFDRLTRRHTPQLVHLVFHKGLSPDPDLPYNILMDVPVGRRYHDDEFVDSTESPFVLEVVRAEPGGERIPGGGLLRWGTLYRGCARPRILQFVQDRAQPPRATSHRRR